MAKRDKKAAEKLLAEARKRYKAATEADRENRQLALEDLRFVHEPGAQWDERVKEARGDTRPCYEFNTLRITCKRIINDIRANRPAGRVRAVEDGDKDTADVIEGLARNIWEVSEGDAAVDAAAEYQVAGGFGAWRVNTEYADDSSWEQDIRIKGIPNPFCLYMDPAAQDDMGRDATYWLLTTKMGKEAFEAKYGDIPVIEWESSEFDDDDEWEGEDSVRICEYWYRKPIVKRLALLVDGQTVDLEAAPVPPEMIRRTRDVKSYQICMAIVSGDRVLEGPHEWAGSMFPFVPVFGERVIIDGKRQWFGIVRHAKDAQRLHNFNLTTAAEAASTAPKTKFWATAAQAEGNTEHWAKAHDQNLPYMLYNPDTMAPGPPQQMAGAQIPAAFLGLAQYSGEGIKAVTGIFDSSLGAKSNESSGIAIRQRQAQGEIATFNYGDNIARAVRRTFEILVDLIPKIYDSERSIRILGTDGAEQYARINTIGPDGQALNDLTRGKYDVQVQVGPNFGTKRQEAAEIYMGLSQGNPQVMGVAGDLIFKALDLPYSDDMAERMKTMLPPQVQQMLAAKDKQGGKALPPEAQMAMAQADQAMALVQQQSQLVQAAAAEVETNQAEAEKAAAGLEVQAAKMQADYQRMLADIAKKEAGLVLKEAQLIAQAAGDEAATGAARQEVEAERQDIGAMVAESTAQLQAQVQEFMQAAAQAIVQIQATTAEAAASVAPRPQNFKIVRDADGSLVGRSESKEVRVKRSQGGGFDSTVTPLQ
jgi:hypothetical protein